jgi:hypothetical protein
LNEKSGIIKVNSDDKPSMKRVVSSIKSDNKKSGIGYGIESISISKKTAQALRYLCKVGRFDILSYYLHRNSYNVVL